MAITNDYTLKISTEEAQKNVNALNKAIDTQNDTLAEMKGKLLDAERALEKINPRDLNRIKNVKDFIAEQKKKIKLETDGLKLTTAERKKADKVLKESQKNAADFGGVMGFLDKQTGGAITAMSGFTKTITGATKGFKLMRIAWMATGLGALVLLITALTGAFTRSEEGQEKWARGMAMIGAVTTQILDKLAELGTAIIRVFTEPKKVFKEFSAMIKKFVTDKVESITKSFGLLGSALKKLFDGDVTGAFNDAKAGIIGLNKELNPGVILVDALVGATKKLVKETKKLVDETSKEVDIIDTVTKMRQKAHHIERDLLTERAEADREVNELRLKAADKINNTTTERIAMLTKASAIQDDITSKEIAAKKLLVDAMVLESSISLSTIEDKDKLAKLQAELITLDTKKLKSQRALARQISAAEKEEIAIKAKAIATEKAEQQALSDFKKGLRTKDKADIYADIEEQKVNNIKALENLKITEAEKNQLLKDIEAKFQADKIIIDVEAKAKRDTALKELENQIAEASAVTDDERRALEILKVTDHYNVLIALAKAQGLATEGLEKGKANAINNLNKKNSDNEIQWEELTTGEKIKIVTKGFDDLASILGKETAAGKAAAIASATISTFESANSSYKSLAGIPVIGPALGAAAAGAAIVSGMAQVKAITKTKIPTIGGKTPPSTGGGPPPAAALPQPPSFNVVGASDTNQLAEAIGEQEQQPVQAFVVSGDVTTSQQLERNIVTGATIG